MLAHTSSVHNHIVISKKQVAHGVACFCIARGFVLGFVHAAMHRIVYLAAVMRLVFVCALQRRGVANFL